MRLAPEGRPFVAVGLVILIGLVLVALLAGGWWWIGAGAWLPVALWVPAFFRDPERPGPRGERLVIAPADGRVVSVVEVDEPEFMGGRALRISVFMNVFNVHVNRHPVSGTVALKRYRPGKFVNAAFDKSSADNEQASIGVAATGGPVLVRQIAGLIARRIVTDPSPGDRVVQGERLGLIRFGSRVDTFLPIGVEPRVRVGDKTTAGMTVIGEWR